MLCKYCATILEVQKLNTDSFITIADPALYHYHIITICLILKLPKAGMPLTIIFIRHI
jgi:hypothetical protein